MSLLNEVCQMSLFMSVGDIGLRNLNLKRDNYGHIGGSALEVICKP